MTGDVEALAQLADRLPAGVARKMLVMMVRRHPEDFAETAARLRLADRFPARSA